MIDQFCDGDNESDDNPDTTEETDAIPDDSEWEVYRTFSLAPIQVMIGCQEFRIVIF